MFLILWLMKVYTHIHQASSHPFSYSVGVKHNICIIFHYATVLDFDWHTIYKVIQSVFLYLKHYLLSWHLRTRVHFLVRHEIRTKTTLLQFPKETNTSFYSFSHKLTEFWLMKRNFQTVTWRISCYDFKTILKSWEIWCFWTKYGTYPASYLWVFFIDGKFVRWLTEYGDVLWRRGALVRIPCNHGSTKQFKSAYKAVEITRLHIQIHFYISFAFINTIG